MIEQLNSVGWSATDGTISALDGAMLKLARHLGTPVPSRSGASILQELSPIPSELGHPQSLTRMFGTEIFPFHTDTSHWLVPAKFIVFGCVNNGRGDRKTDLLPWEKMNLSGLEICELKASQYVVKNGRHSFFSPVLQVDDRFVRYDPGCMKPTERNDIARGILSEDRIKTMIESINWEEGKIVVVNNWKILHRRGASSSSDPGRKIRRIIVE